MSEETRSITNVLSEESKTPWIKITVAGMSAGVVVAAVTYAAAENSSHAVANVTGTGIQLAGRLVGAGADLIGGPMLGTTVRIVSSAAAETTKQSILTSGRLGSAAIAATAGAVTALSITIGTRLIEYTVEYGGVLTREAAVKLSEMYLKYKSVQSGFVESGNITDLNSDQWVFVGDPTLINDEITNGDETCGDVESVFSSTCEGADPGTSAPAVESVGNTDE
jgi:hypothetical protein